MKHKGIAEQIGRMVRENLITDIQAVERAEEGIQAYTPGRTSKEIEKELRHYRLSMKDRMSKNAEGVPGEICYSKAIEAAGNEARQADRSALERCHFSVGGGCPKSPTHHIEKCAILRPSKQRAARLAKAIGLPCSVTLLD